MDDGGVFMDNNKKFIQLTVNELRPVVSVANYFEVSRGRYWGERQMPDFELILIVEGRFAYETRTASPLILSAGDVLLIPPMEWHTVRRLDEPAHAVFSCIHGELIPGASWAQGDYGFSPPPQRVTRTDGDAAIHDLFMRCRTVFEGYDKYRAVLLETILKEIWVRLAGFWSGGQSGDFPGRMKVMVSYLRTHLDQKITRRSLAHVFGVTPEHVNALFKKQLGVTPTQFIHREQMQLAYRYLRDEGLSVKETAARLGYDDPFYFSRVFKRVMHRTPASVR
jgi:AraC-like DNA-binding protein/quercetin dioxygenase-like cupin family protein